MRTNNRRWTYVDDPPDLQRGHFSEWAFWSELMDELVYCAGLILAFEVIT